MTETLNTTGSKPGRKAIYIVGGLIVLALLAAFALVAYNVVAAPAIAKATAAKCHEAYSAPAAREACTSGDTTKAVAAQKAFKAQQKRAAVAAACSAKYTSTLAIVDCKNGDTTAADSEQKTADAAAAAAAKKATQGQSFDNPMPAGTHVRMQSTNRLDGTKVTYVEWVTGFDGDWRGYDEFEAPDAGMKYVAFVVNLQATDAGVDAGSAAYDASFTDQNGSVYSRDTVTYQATPQMPQITLGAGQSASGVVAFKVPASVTGGVATFGDGTVFAALR
jgi:hypothetical protein